MYTALHACPDVSIHTIIMHYRSIDSAAAMSFKHHYMYTTQITFTNNKSD